MTDPVIAQGPEHATSRRIPWPIVWGLGAALFLLAIVWFGREVTEGDGASIDRAIMLAMRVAGHPDQPAGPAWLPSAMRDVTALGSSTILTFVVIAASVFLWLHGKRRSALLVVLATTLGSTVVTIIKALVGRARPDLFERLMAETSHSFPSGHAANSAIIYLTLATLLFPVVPERRMRAFLLAVALLLTGMVGLSRVYLGVHWPSDVIAGWAFGALWALLWWRIELRLIARPA